MRKPKFLILLEGKTDVRGIAKLFRVCLEILLDDIVIEIREDVTREALVIENVNDETTIYIKNAINQNVKDFNKFISDENSNLESIEKLYNIKEILTAIYSIYDYDPGSTFEEHYRKYFNLKENQDNFYPIMSYPGYEAQDIQGYHFKLSKKFEEIKSDKSLDNIEKLLGYITVTDKEILTENTPDVAKRMKKLLTQLKRSQDLKEDMSHEKYNRVLKYIYQMYNNSDYFYYLEEQEEIFESAIEENIIKISSFIFCVLESIIAWIEDEDEE